MGDFAHAARVGAGTTVPSAECLVVVRDGRLCLSAGVGGAMLLDVALTSVSEWQAADGRVTLSVDGAPLVFDFERGRPAAPLASLHRRWDRRIQRHFASALAGPSAPSAAATAVTTMQ